MKIEEQFQLVLEFAIKNGWDICGFLNSANCDSWQKGIHQWQNVVDLEIYYAGHKRVVQADTVYFNHDFAQAFFGNNYLEWLRDLAIIPPGQRLEALYNSLKTKEGAKND